MPTIKVLGIDLGKSSLHLIDRDHRDQNTLRKKLSRSKLIEFIAQLPNCTIAFETCGRTGMHFVPVKSEDAQMLTVCHCLRGGFVSERTKIMCLIGAILLEFGLALPKGHATMKGLFQRLGKQKMNCLTR